MQASFVESELHRNKLVFRAKTSIVASMHWFPKYNLKIKPACFKGWWFSSSARTKVTVLYITCYFWIFKGGTKILSICWTFLLWYKLTGSVKQWQAQRWVQQPPNNLAGLLKNIFKNWNATWGSIVLIYFHNRATKKVLQINPLHLRSEQNHICALTPTHLMIKNDQSGNQEK